MSTLSPTSSSGMCNLGVDTTLPLVCIGSLLSFLCGVGIGANDLSANFAMVVGSGSLNMRQAIIYCTIFELLGAAFMGGHVGNTIRNGIVESSLFNQNRDLVIIGMTCATFAAALWLYLSTVFGLPVSITHTVIGSIIGFAIFSTWSFSAIRVRGVVVIVLSWVLAPVAACAVTALCFYSLRRYVLLVPGRSFQLALRVLPYCLAFSLLVDYMFVVIERPPILTTTLAAYLPVWVLYLLLLLGIFVFCWAVERWAFPKVAHVAMTTSSFVWESPALRTEPVEPIALTNAAEPVAACGGTEEESAVSVEASDALGSTLSLFKPSPSNHSRGAADAAGSAAPQHPPPSGAAAAAELINASFGSLLFAKTEREDRASVEPAPNTSTATGGVASEGRRGRSPARSTVLSSLTASDNHITRSTSVHLAPVGGRRSPLPAHHVAASTLTASTTRSTSRSTTPALPPPPLSLEKNMSGSMTPSDTYRHFDASQLPTSSERAHEGSSLITVSHQGASQTGGTSSPDPTAARHYGATEQATSAAAAPLHTRSFVAPKKHRTRSTEAAATTSGAAVEVDDSDDTASVRSDDEFGEEDWQMDHPMQPIVFGGLLIKPFNPRAEFLFTGLQVVAGSMSSFVHGAVAGANATATFVILYEVFSNHELGETDLSARWSVLPAMLGIAIGMFSLGAALMKTVGMELVTVTPARGWCIQVGGTLVTMVLTGLGIPVSLSQSQVGAAIGCGMLDAKMRGVSWGLVGKIVGGWVVTLVISAVTTGVTMLVVASLLCS